MRIGLVTAPWLPVPPKRYGGTETVVDHLARGLYDAGHDVMLCATADSECPVPLAPGLAHSTGLPGYGPRFEIAQALSAYETLEEWEPDIVHDHSLVGPLIGGRSDLKVVTTNHTTFDVSTVGLYRWCAARDVAVVAISNHHASTAPGLVSTVIHHGIDVDTQPFGDGAGGYALFVGRFHECKGPDVAIRVARAAGLPLKLAAKDPRPPEEREFFESRIAPELRAGAVEYVGEPTRAERAELMADAVCLINPIQWNEPFGMVVIESLAHGTPVVATPRGSMPELIEEGATGFVCASEGGLAESVRAATALDRARCRKSAQACFSTEVMVAAHERLYERVAR